MLGCAFSTFAGCLLLLFNMLSKTITSHYQHCQHRHNTKSNTTSIPIRLDVCFSFEMLPNTTTKSIPKDISPKLTKMSQAVPRREDKSLTKANRGEGGLSNGGVGKGYNPFPLGCGICPLDLGCGEKGHRLLNAWPRGPGLADYRCSCQKT